MERTAVMPEINHQGIQKQQYPGIDLLKFFFSICVLIIHVEILSGSAADWLNPLVTRLAVPFFFVASGFFVGEKLYHTKDGTPDQIIKPYILKLFQKLVIFELITLAIRIPRMLYEGETLIRTAMIVARSVFFYPWGALWYIQAVIVALLLLYPFIKRKKEWLGIPIGLLLFVFALICNRYHFLIEGTPLDAAVGIYMKIFVSARNGLFQGVLLISTGLMLSKHLDRFAAKKHLILIAGALSYLCLVLETYLLRDHEGIDDNSLFISYLVLIPSILLIAALYRFRWVKGYKLLRNLSTSIYLLHSPIIWLLNFISLLAVGSDMSAPVLLVCAVSAIGAICLIVYGFKPRAIYNLIR